MPPRSALALAPPPSNLLRALALAAAAALVARAQDDTHCGNATLPLAAGKKNVLLVGDSCVLCAHRHLAATAPFSPLAGAR